MAMTDTTAGAPEQATEEQEGATPAGERAAPAQETAELRDRLLRSLAEMENMRRRTEREVADARSYGISAFARDLLAVADNMRRALDAVGIEARENAEPGLKSLIEGVELTERELLNVLEKHGVKKLDPEGGKFDPHRHQAMFEVPEAAVPPGT